MLRGLIAEWPAVQSWTLDSLAASYGETPVTVARLDAGKVVWDAEKGLLHERAPLGPFIRALQEGGRDRYVMAPMEELPAGLGRDLAPPPYCAGAAWTMWVLWIGAAGTVSRMHRDLADNLHCQIAGRKRFTLVAPRFNGDVYPNHLWDSVPNGCRVDIEEPDFARFPRLRGVETMVADLEPGDAIYIPRWWWHHVRTVETGISANFWWANGLRAAVVLGGDWLKRLRRISR